MCRDLLDLLDREDPRDLAEALVAAARAEQLGRLVLWAGMVYRATAERVAGMVHPDP